MSTSAPLAPAASLRNLPVNLFASVMGISGLALAWRFSAYQFHTDIRVANGIGIVAIAVFVLLSIGYVTKIIRHPDAVRNEFNHPVLGNFFGTFNISILLLSAVISPFSRPAAEVVWTIGSVVTVVLGLVMMHRLLRGKIDSACAVPAWLIPGVAALDITVAGSTMPMAWARELNLFALGVGSMIALVFFTLIISRLIHHQDSLATGMTPSLMILIAPFEVGFQAYTGFTQRVDDLAAMLFYFGFFLFLILAFRVFRGGIPFAAGWWAVGFPLAALVNSALKYSAAIQSGPLTWLAVILLASFSILIAILFVRTLYIALNGTLLRGQEIRSA